MSGGFVYEWVALGIAFVAGLLATILLPILSWFLGFINVSIHVQAVKDTIQQIKPDQSPTAGGAPIERIIGAVVFILILLLLLRAIRRQWKLLQPEEPGREREPEPQVNYVPKLRRHRTPRIRRELPVDTIRRWYAEALLALERLGLPKPPSRTPGIPSVRGTVRAASLPDPSVRVKNNPSNPPPAPCCTRPIRDTTRERVVS